MRTALDDRSLATILPGRWRLAASNFPLWLEGDRLHPVFDYETISAAPLVLRDTVSYLRSDGSGKKIVGVDRWRHDGFVWRGRGLLRVATSRWMVSGMSEDDALAVLRFSKTLFTPAGIDVIVREDSVHSEPRATIASSAEDYGLTAEEFASLGWLPPRSHA